jgi:hypothetical protein
MTFPLLPADRLSLKIDSSTSTFGRGEDPYRSHQWKAPAYFSPIFLLSPVSMAIFFTPCILSLQWPFRCRLWLRPRYSAHGINSINSDMDHGSRFVDGFGGDSLLFQEPCIARQNPFYLSPEPDSETCALHKLRDLRFVDFIRCDLTIFVERIPRWDGWNGVPHRLHISAPHLW